MCYVQRGEFEKNVGEMRDHKNFKWDEECKVKNWLALVYKYGLVIKCDLYIDN